MLKVFEYYTSGMGSGRMAKSCCLIFKHIRSKLKNGNESLHLKLQLTHSFSLVGYNSVLDWEAEYCINVVILTKIIFKEAHESEHLSEYVPQMLSTKCYMICINL
jgi:hypothetical protein